MVELSNGSGVKRDLQVKVNNTTANPLEMQRKHSLPYWWLVESHFSGIQVE